MFFYKIVLSNTSEILLQLVLGVRSLTFESLLMNNWRYSLNVCSNFNSFWIFTIKSNHNRSANHKTALPTFYTTIVPVIYSRLDHKSFLNFPTSSSLLFNKTLHVFFVYFAFGRERALREGERVKETTDERNQQCRTDELSTRRGQQKIPLKALLFTNKHPTACTAKDGEKLYNSYTSKMKVAPPRWSTAYIVLTPLTFRPSICTLHCYPCLALGTAKNTNC